MNKQRIHTNKAPEPSGFYSQAIKLGNLIFTSSLGGVEPQTGDLAPGGVGPQVRQALENLEAILEAAGTSMTNVVRVTVYLSDFADFEAYNEVYSAYFDPESPPARTTVEVGRFPGDMAVAMDAIAFVP